MRAVRRVSPVRAASPSRSTGPSPRASKTPSSLAANKCLLAMKPCAISKIRSGATTAWAAGPRAWCVVVMPISLTSGCPRPLSHDSGGPAAHPAVVLSRCGRSADPAGPRRHPTGASARADVGGLRRGRCRRPRGCHPVRRLLLPHGRPRDDPVHRQHEPQRGVLRLMARPPRVRRRGRQQMVLPRPQWPDRGGDQHRHPRRTVPLRPAPVPRDLRLR